MPAAVPVRCGVNQSKFPQRAGRLVEKMKGFSLLLLLAAPARSTDFSWDPPTGTNGLWTDAAYWSPELVPTYASQIEVRTLLAASRSVLLIA